MAYIELDKSKLRHNYQFLDDLFKRYNKEWGVVSKMLCGHKGYLEVLLDLGIKEIHDSRISNLKTVKRIDPSVQTVYIKPPAKKQEATSLEACLGPSCCVHFTDCRQCLCI